MNRINAAIAQAMELCPRPELVLWGRRWISGDDRSQETVASIAAAIGVLNVPADPFAAAPQGCADLPVRPQGFPTCSGLHGGEPGPRVAFCASLYSRR